MKVTQVMSHVSKHREAYQRYRHLSDVGTGSRVHDKFNAGCLNRISIDAIWDLFV
jgi:hypothetical protein